MSSSLSNIALKYVSEGAITWLSVAASTSGLMGSAQHPLRPMWLWQRPLCWKRSSNHEHEGQRKERKSRGLFVPDNPLGCVQTGSVWLEGKIRLYNYSADPKQRSGARNSYLSRGKLLREFPLAAFQSSGCCIVTCEAFVWFGSYFLSLPFFFPFSSCLFCFWKNDIPAPHISRGNTHICCSSVLPRRQKMFLIITHDLIIPAFPPLPRSFIIIINFSGTYSQL